MSKQTRADEFQNAVPLQADLIVVGIFDRRSDAEAAISDLESTGFRRDDISLIMQQPERSEDPIGSGKTKADQGTVVGVSTGAVLGGIAGLAALAIPGKNVQAASFRAGAATRAKTYRSVPTPLRPRPRQSASATPFALILPVASWPQAG